LNYKCILNSDNDKPKGLYIYNTGDSSFIEILNNGLSLNLAGLTGGCTCFNFCLSLNKLTDIGGCNGCELLLINDWYFLEYNETVCDIYGVCCIQLYGVSFCGGNPPILNPCTPTPN